MSSVKKIIAKNGVPMLSARHASKRLKCAADYVGKLCREGKLEGEQIDGAWFVREDSIALFEKTRKEARTLRSIELTQQRKEESARYRKLYGIEDAAPIEISAATPTFASQGLVATKWGRLAALSFGAAFLFAAVVFAGGSGKAYFFTNGQQLAAALSEVHSPFFGSFASSAAPAVTSAPEDNSGFFSDVFAFLFGARTPAAKIADISVPAVTTKSVVPTAAPATAIATHTTTPTGVKQTIVQNNTYPVIERTVIKTQSGITQAELDTQLSALSNNLRRVIFANAGSVTAPTYSGGGSTVTNLALSQIINQLSNVAISGGTISGANISGGSISNVSIPVNDLSGIVGITQGGTGTSTAPTYGKLLLGNALGAYNLVSTSSLGISGVSTFVGLSDVPSSLAVGDVLYASAANTLSALPIGSSGKVLKIQGGLPVWGTDLQGSGGGSSAWATTTDSLAVYPADPTQVIIVGNSATTTTGNIFEVTGNALFRNQVTAYRTITAPTFVATSTIASSVFPFASSTVLTVSSIGYFGTASTTNLTVSGIANALLSTQNGGVVGATTVSSPLTFSGSTLAITQATTGANGYLSSTDFNTFNNKISSTSLSATYPLAYNSTTGVFTTNFGTTTANTFSALNTFNGGVAANTLSVTTSASIASTTLTGNTLLANATTTTFAITNISSALLKTLSNGAVVAAVAGTDYQAAGNYATFAYPFPAGATTTQIAFNGGATFVGATTTALAVTGSSTINTLNLTNALSIANGGTGTTTAPTYGKLLLGNAGGTYDLVATSSLGITGGGGTFTSIGPLGQLQTGPSVTLATSTTGSDFTITATGNVITYNLPSVSLASRGLLTASDFATFNNKISSTSLSATYPLAYNSSTGVFTTAFGTTTANTFSQLQIFTAGILTNASSTLGNFTANFATTSQATTTNFAITGISSALLKTLSNGAVVAAVAGVDYAAAGGGSGAFPFTPTINFGVNTSATSTPLFAQLGLFASSTSHFAAFDFTIATGSNLTITGSSTIGNGAQAGGLTVSGGATTTGTSYFAANVGIGNVAPTKTLDVTGTGRFTSTLTLSGTLSCTGGQALQTDVSGNITCGTIASGGSSTGGGWTTNNIGSITLATSTDRVGVGATSTPYAKFSILSGAAATTTLALVPAAGQTANILDIYDTSGALATVFTSAGNFGIGTTSPFAKLSVAGNALIYGTLSAGNTTLANATSTGTFAVTGSTTLAALLNVGGALNANSTLTVAGNTTLSNATSTNEFTQSLLTNTAAFGQTGTSTFTSTGALGIGTSSPYALLSLFAASSTTGAIPTTLFAISSTTSSFATSTLFSISNTGSTTLFQIPSSLLKTNANGTIVAAVAGVDYATPASLGAAYPFTPTINFGVNTSATSTPLFAQLGLFASSTSHFAALDFAIATGTNLTITGSSTINGQFNALGGATFGSVTLSNLSNALIYVNGSGNVISTTTLAVNNGGTGSTSLTGILKGNGTGAVGTLAIGSGLTFDGTTLATNGAGITAIGPLGQTQTGGTQLFATSTTGTDFTITASTNTQTFNLPFASLSANGKLSSTDFATFNNKISSTSLSGASVISYNSGTGVITTTGGTFGAGNYIFPGNASSSLLSAYGAYFGSTATSSFDSAGVLTLASALGIANGGTNNTSFSRNSLLYFDGTKIAATSSNALYVGSLFATTTTATSTLQGGLSVANSLFVLQNGNIGIGNSTPGKTLDITGTARVSSTFTLAGNASCVGGNALQTDVQGNVSCGTVSFTGITTAGGWSTNSIGSVTLATTSDRVGLGATSTPYAKLSILSGGAGTTTLALVPASGQTANILDIYDTSGALATVFTAAGKFGLGTTSPFATLSVAGNGFFNSDLTASNITATGTLSAGGTTLVTTAAGNVGIGSSSPMSHLSISGGNLTQVAAGNPILATSVPAIAAAHSYKTFVSGNYAYEAEYEGGLRIFDVTNPKIPTLVGTYSTYTAVDDVIVSGKYAYIADATAGIAILDVSNPTSPTLLGTYAVSSTPYAVGIALSGKYLFATDMNNHAVRVLDVSNPSSPVLAGSYNGGVTSSPRAIAVSGKYAYVADYAPAVYVLDISVPSNPTKISASYTTNVAGPNGVYVSGKYLYVADVSAKGMYILNISNPTSLTLAGTYNPGGTASYEDVKVAGNYAYLADDASNLTQVDVSNKAAPTLVGSYALGAVGRGVALVGKYAYVSADTQGMKIVDINGIESPAASIGSLATNIANVSDSLTVGNDIFAGGGLSVGISGIFSRGGLSIFGSTTLSAPLTVNASTTLTGNLSALSGNIQFASTTLFGNTLLTNATTTSFFATIASTTNLTISSVQSSLLKTNASGAVVAAVAGTDYVTGAGLASAFPFTPTNNFGVNTSATSTPLFAQLGLFASSTSHFAALDFTIATGTNLTITGSSTINGQFNAVGGATFGALTAGASTLASLTVTGNTTLANATSTSLFSTSHLSNTAAFGTTGTTTFLSNGNVGLGTSTPYGVLSLFVASSTYNTNTLFAIASSTSSFATSTLFTISNTGLVTGNTFSFGSGTTSALAVTGSTTVAGAFNSLASNLLGSTTLLGNSLFGFATTTNFAITGTANTLLKTLSNGAVVAAVAGTDYANFAYPFIANATSSTLTFGGGLVSNGSTTISGLSSGLVGNSNGLLYSFASSSLFGFTPASNATTLTINGTANQLTSSAGAQDLSANRTWTLSLPSHVIFPTDFVAAAGSTTNATTTNLHITSLTNGGLAVDTNGRVYASATSTLSTISGTLALTQLANQAANTILANGTGGSAAPTAIATSTLFGVSTPGFVLANTASGLQLIASTTYAGGAGISTSFANNTLTITNTGALFAFPFTPTNNFGVNTSATSTPIFAQLGLFASSTSHFAALDFAIATGSNLTITGSSTINGQFNAVGGATFGTLTAGAATLASLTVNGNTSLQNATSSSEFTSSLLANVASFGKTGTTTITGAGFVGIGTTSPYSNLSVVGTTTTTGIFNADNQSGLLLSYLGSTTISIAGTSNFFAGIGANGSTTKVTGTQNVFVGNQAGYAVTGLQNVYIGALSGQGPTTGAANSGTNNTAVGYATLQVDSTGGNNSAFGSGALALNTTGSTNDAFGSGALAANTIGSNNDAVGVSALASNTAGTNNVSFGGNTLRFNTTGSNNTALGYTALFLNTTGTNNTAIGYEAGRTITTGYSNTIIGDNSTIFNTVISTGAGNIGLGSNVFFPDPTANSQLNIGNIIYGTLPATSTSYQLPSSGSVGIATTSPFAKFAIQNNASSTSLSLFAVGSTTNVGGTLSNSTLFSISNTGSTTLFQLSSSLLKTDANGAIIAAVAGVDYVTGVALTSAFPFTPTTNYGVNTSATSTPLYAVNGLFASSTSHFANVDFTGATSTGTFAVTGSSTIAGQFNAVGGATFGTLTAGAATLASLTVNGNTSLQNATSTTEFTGRSVANTAAFGQTATTTFDSAGNLSVGAVATIFGSNTGTSLQLSTSPSSGTLISGFVGGMSTGKGLSFTGSGSGSLSPGFSGQYINVAPTRTLTSGTITDSGNFLLLNRSNTSQNATFNITGDLAKLTSTCDGSTGACVDSSTLLNIIQSATSSTGTVLKLSNTGTGSLATFSGSGAFGVGSSSPFAKMSIHAFNGEANRVLFAIGSSTQSATSTLFSISNTGSTTLFQLPSSLLKTDANGAIIAAVAGVDYAAGNVAFEFTPQTLGNATGTLLLLNNGVIAAASSTIGNGTQTGGLTISGGATTTGNAYVSGTLTANSATAINASSGTSLSFDNNTTGSNIAITQVTTGKGLSISNLQSVTSGKLIDLGAGTGGGAGGAFTGKFISVGPTSRTVSSNLTDTGNYLSLNRPNISTASLTVSGDLASFTSSCNGASGICNDTSSVLSLTQSATSSSGAVLKVATVGSGPLATFSGTGNFGIGTTSPFAKLSVHAANGDINTLLFSIGSSTQSATSTLFSISNTGSTTLFQLSSSLLKTDANGTIIAAIAGTDYVTGTALSSAYPFQLSGNATSTLTQFNGGLTAYASSTIGNGNQGGGLTINGGATTTGTAYFAGNVGVGTTSPYRALSIVGTTTTTGIFNIDNAAGLLLSYLGSTIVSVAGTNNFFAGLGANGSTTKTNGTDNVSIGLNAGSALTGSFNVYVGSLSGLGSTTGAANTGSENTAVGRNTLKFNSSGADNSAFGMNSLINNTVGINNSAVGVGALFHNTTGGDNNAFGDNALFNNVSGNNNAAFGSYALNTTNGSNNTAIGYQAGYSVTSGYSNTLIGDNTTTNNTITTGFGNLGLGSNIFFPSATSNSQLNIGNLIFGTLPATSTAFLLPTSGSIGIGTSSPFAKFAIQTNNGDTATTLFAIGSSTASATTTLFSVDNTGTASTTKLFGAFLTPCNSGNVLTWAAGVFGCAVDQTSAGAANPFTWASNYGVVAAATTSPLWAQNGVFASSTSHFVTADFSGKVGLASTTPWGQLSVNANGVLGPAFVVGSSTKTSFIVTSNNNSGFGTTTPWGKLSVDTTLVDVGTPSFVIGSSTRTDVVVSQGGWVGLGTAAPSANLEVSGTSTGLTLNGFNLTNTANATSTGFAQTFRTFDITGNATSTSAITSILQKNFSSGGLGGNGDLAFSTLNFGKLTEAARLTAAGSLGIGTTTPWGLLSINPNGITGPSFVIGSSTLTSFIVTNGGNVGVGTTSPYARFSVSQTASVSQFSLAYDSSDATDLRTDATGNLWVVPQGSAGGNVLMTNDNLWVCTGGSITSNTCPSGTPSGKGNIIVQSKISIGTTTPTGQFTVASSTNAGIADFISLDTANTLSPRIVIGSVASTTRIVLDNSAGIFRISSSKANDGSSATQILNIDGGSGFVGIGTTTPSQQLSISQKLFVGAGNPTTLGTATSTFQGDVLITGKLDVSTIDPVYTIDGTKFATYGVSGVGVKEEVSATVTLAEKNGEGKYEYDIDFSKLEKGSDLWLFYQVTTFGDNWKDLVANLTPGFDGSVYYTKDPATNTLRVVSSAPGEVSMRLISTRFDSRDWSNIRPDQNGGFAGFQLQSK